MVHISCNVQYLSSPLQYCVCSDETTSAHSCKKCSRGIHSNCAPRKNIYATVLKLIALFMQKNALAIEKRHSSKDKFQEQAQKTLKTSKKFLINLS